MKKLVTLFVAVLSVFTLAGCEKATKATDDAADKGAYKPGTYEETVVDDYNNEGNIASAKVVIDNKGKIQSLYLDTTYKVNGVETTKKALGDEYNMKKYNPSASGEWYEQVKKLEDAVVEHQGVDFITLKEDNTSDAVSGCTIKINALVEATTKALDKAK